MGSNSQANDAMIRRLERELEERNSFVQGLIAQAQDSERDLTDAEKSSLIEVRGRMTGIKDQLDQLESTADLARQVAERAKQIDAAVSQARHGSGKGPVEYRTAGAYMLDEWRAHTGDRAAQERLEVFQRAAAHQKTGDNAGAVPDPVIGEVLNFIDAARPIVSALGPRDLPGATWHRPKVTGHTNVAKQGPNGAAADEKTELASQKMTITRITANAVTYGGYVNVSRQNVDFSSPQILDLVIQDLAAEYATETEAAAAAALTASANTVELAPVATSGTPTSDEILTGLWTAAGNVWNATRGQGRLVLAVASDQLGVYGRVFGNFVNPQNAASPGFQANTFGQGTMGSISGIPVLMSSGLPTGQPKGSAFLFSTSALEAYEQRVGALQAVEPSVLGVQVAYAGYFTPVTVEAGGIVKLVNAV